MSIDLEENDLALYALRAFEENAIDYLLKPISEEKLERAVAKVTKILAGQVRSPIDLEKVLQSLEKRDHEMRRFSVKAGDKILIIPDNKVSFFSAEDKYTFLHTEDKSYFLPLTLKELEERFDPEKFIRVRRSAIINIETISSVHRWFGGRLLIKTKSGKEIVVSQTYIEEFKKPINL